MKWDIKIIALNLNKIDSQDKIQKPFGKKIVSFTGLLSNGTNTKSGWFLEQKFVFYIVI